MLRRRPLRAYSEQVSEEISINLESIESDIDRGRVLDTRREFLV